MYYNRTRSCIEKLVGRSLALECTSMQAGIHPDAVLNIKRHETCIYYLPMFYFVKSSNIIPGRFMGQESTCQRKIRKNM